KEPLGACNFMLDNTGNTVAQATSNTTAVPLNARAGVITMNTALAGGPASATFALTNNYITAASIVLVWVTNTLSTTAHIAPSVTAGAAGAGTVNITVTNNDPTGGNALTAAAQVQFLVI